jgi:hypothetical protein
VKKIVIIGCIGAVLLLGLAAASYYMHRGDGERISELETELRALREREKQSEINRDVSQQMEEIAYGQQTLSEERSREAIRQSEIAQAATLRSEAERRIALQAQAAAEISAGEAKASYRMAEQRRLEAEHAKLVADTLNYISLGRTLGSQSYAIYRSGDTELGNMLAYASYVYTNDYGGNLYTPAVFQALTQSAGGRRSWSVHDSKITRMDIMPKSGHLLTVSDNGEFFIHKRQDGQLTAQRQIRDRNYCFRDVYAANNGQAYAISYTGHLMIVGRNQTKVVYVEHVDRPFSLQHINNGHQLLIIGENSVALFDLATDKVIATSRLDFHVTSIGRRDGKPLLFDNRGRMHLVNSLDDISNEKVPVQGQVTAFASSKHDHLTAYGMADGTIWLTAGNGKTYKLVEHLSRVTEMEFNGHRLYSSSYDGKLLFWSIDYNSQMKAVTLFQADSWIVDIIFSGDKDYIWTGEKNGTVSRYLVSLPKIAQRLRQNVKRNFTQEEWNYYVGKGIPYLKVKE